jgi:hypothetical protein
VAVSSDGKIIATTSADGTARLWDRATGKPRHRLTPGAKSGDRTVWTATFSPDSKLIALAHQDAGITLWDANTGILKRQIPTSEHAVHALAFRPDGNRLVSHVAEWDVTTGKESGRLNRYRAGAGLALSSNGRKMAVATGERVYLWHEGDREPAWSHNREGLSVAFSLGGILLATTGNDGVHFVESATGKKVAETLYYGIGSGRQSLAFSPDGRFLAVAERERLVLWEIGAEQERHAFAGHLGPITSIAFTPDGKALVSGSADGTALLWDVERVVPAEPPFHAQGLFEELLTADFLRAHAIFCRMCRAPDETLVELRKRLPPNVQAPRVHVPQLLKDLDSAQYVTRARAGKELRQYGLVVEKALRKARHNKPSVELARRLDDLLDHADMDWSRCQWCLKVLEEIDTSAARALLQTLAKGDPNSRLTAAADASLKKAQKRGGPR